MRGRRGLLSRNISLNISSSPLILDTYPGAAAAYSLRKLRIAYTGAAIRVRRSSDSAEQDIGFDGAGNLDTSALTTFVGAGDGLVTTWYDQSGNARHATQTTVASQPQIVSSGVLATTGGKPSISFVDPGSGATKLSVPVWHAANAPHVWLFSAYKLTSTGNFQCLLGTTPPDHGFLSVHSGSSGVARLATIRGAVSAYNIGSDRTNLFTMISLNANRTNLSGWINGTGGVVGDDTNADFTMPTNYEITDGGYAVSSGNMSVSEMILYASDQSSSRAAIESAINSHYSIY